MRNKKENRKSNPNFPLPFIFHSHQTAFPTAAGAAATAIAIIRRLRPHCAITVHHRCIRAFDIDDDISTFVHRVDDNFEFKLGMMFNSEDEAFNTYNAYARNKGFGVRKGQKYIHGKSQELRRCTFLCSCEGHAPYVPPHEERKVERIETDVDVFKISTGLWEVIEFNPIHNHPFFPEHQRHLIRSHRRLTEGVKGVLDSFKSVGVGATKSFGFIANDTGGIRNVGCTLRDAQNYLQSERSGILSAGDAQSLFPIIIPLNLLVNETLGNPNIKVQTQTTQPPQYPVKVIEMCPIQILTTEPFMSTPSQTNHLYLYKRNNATAQEASHSHNAEVHRGPKASHAL
ncbi:hypothetical protein RJ639_033386, partial [Escallonia herrerae]